MTALLEAAQKLKQQMRDMPLVNAYCDDRLNDDVAENPQTALDVADSLAPRIASLYNAVATLRAEAQAQLKEGARK